ncbi:unnamed protein product [Calicophoron daubneyi]|uniref:Ku domain-containing protein n=1 Tax=Calicophoron daubneyi TaxID=300641 RepID=A0AAV2TNW5_CALDB
MSDIDRTLDSFLDEEEEVEGDENTSQRTRTGIIFLIDCTPSMMGFDQKNESVANVSASRGLDIGLLCCQTVLMNKAISNPTDMVGLVLMRTRESSSAELQHIYVLQPLAVPDAPRILELERLRKLSPDELKKRFGTIVGQPVGQFGIHEALWACQNMFSSCSKSLGYRQIFLITDDPDPHHGNLRLKRQAVIKKNDLKQSGIALEVLPIKREGCKFDFHLFYHDLVSDDDLDFFGIESANKQVDPAERMEELLTHVRARELQQRRLARITFHLGPDPELALGVSVYCLVRRAPLPLSVWISASDNAPVTVRRHRYKISDSSGSYSQTDDILLPNDLVRGLYFGDRYLCFEADELSSNIRDLVPVGLHLLGFKPIKRLRRHHYLRPAQFIYPDEALIRGSRAWFSTLLESCLRREVMAICVYVQRKGLAPRLVALLPQAEKKDEDEVQLLPPGFHVIFLPYADDFRSLDLPTHELASDQQVEVAKSLVRKLMVPFDPQQISNPNLQRYYAILEALALNREAAEDVADHTMPNLAAIKRRAGDEIDAFKQICHLDELSPTKKSKIPGKSAPRSKTDAELDEDELRKLAESGGLAKLTVVMLRHALKILNLVPLGNRKSELVDQITKYFQK